MSDQATDVMQVMVADAEAIALLLRQRRGDKVTRRKARAVLAQAFAVIDRGDRHQEDEQRMQPVGRNEALSVQVTMQAARRALGDDYRSAVRRIADVWIRKPLPVRVMTLVFDAQRQRMLARMQARAHVPLALNDERVDWIERRCQAEQPGVVREVRPAANADSDRLLASELELIRKRGRSRFS